METKISLERVIDGGANQGDWSAALIQSRPELRNVVLIEPNKQLNHILKKRFRGETKVSIKCFALDYRNDALPFIINAKEDTHAHLQLTNSE
ncbi:MAG: hypothetical protein CMC93_00985 [Flavobacteriaceae bacterium]|nr:hypothetical protein [Flavobacteriaceae bacterium]|tara:strand:+ start:422 stop:697 length:276 start_codon:yes stop_codon:yes gene_type:complete